MNYLKVVTFFLIFAFCLAIPVLAHSGRTDSRGGHHDRIHGGYHYHNAGFSLRTYSPSSRGYSYRSNQGKTSYRSSARKQRAKKKAVRPPRLVIRRPKYTNCEYREIVSTTERGGEISYIESDLKLLEVTARSEAKKRTTSTFYVVDNLFEKESSHSLPSVTHKKLCELLKNTLDEKEEAYIYLGGMSRSTTSWAYSKPLSSSKRGVWIRDTSQAEFEGTYPRLLRYEFREWIDKTGAHKVVAALVFKLSEHVVLLKKNGRRIFVPLSKLSEQDLDYLKCVEQK